jgi:predicted dinucleotide-utilizing enzyme
VTIKGVLRFHLQGVAEPILIQVDSMGATSDHDFYTKAEEAFRRDDRWFVRHSGDGGGIIVIREAAIAYIDAHLIQPRREPKI